MPIALPSQTDVLSTQPPSPSSFGEQSARVVGRAITAVPEPAMREADIDHVWIHLDVGEPKLMVLTLNTFSKKNKDAGFDPRVRLARIEEKNLPRPAIGISFEPLLNYEELETIHHPRFATIDKQDLHAFLTQVITSAGLVEAWGFLFRNRNPGLHQIHCRRASCAVPENLVGCDGALRVYHPENALSDLLLFKFCGQ